MSIMRVRAIWRRQIRRVAARHGIPAVDVNVEQLRALKEYASVVTGGPVTYMTIAQGDEKIGMNLRAPSSSITAVSLIAACRYFEQTGITFDYRDLLLFVDAPVQPVRRPAPP